MKSFRLSSKETLQKPTKVGKPKEVYRDPYTIISKQVVQFEGFQKKKQLQNQKALFDRLET